MSRYIEALRRLQNPADARLEVERAERREAHDVLRLVTRSAGVNQIKHILPVGSGKGGVGKTLVAVYASIILSPFGRTVLADLDGLPDADILLGAASGFGFTTAGRRQATVQDVIQGRVPLDAAVAKTGYQNLRFLCGGVGRSTAKSFSQVYPILMSLPADYVVVDLGAGWEHAELVSQFNALMLVVEPAAASLRDAETYIRAVILERWVRETAMEGQAVTDIYDQVLAGRLDLVDANLKTRGEIGRTAGSIHFYVMGNQVNSREDEEAIDQTVRRWGHYGPDIRRMGSIPTIPAITDRARSGGLVHPTPREIQEPLQLALHHMFSTPEFQSDRNFLGKIWSFFTKTAEEREVEAMRTASHQGRRSAAQEATA